MFHPLRVPGQIGSAAVDRPCSERVDLHRSPVGAPRAGVGWRRLARAVMVGRRAWSRITVVCLIALIGGTLAGCGPGARPKPKHHQEKVFPSPSPLPLHLPAAESGVLPWSLGTPLSREVVLPGPGAGQITILGGLYAGGGSSAGVEPLATSGGALASAGSLTGPLHDAAGAILSGKDTVFGGGTAGSTAAVQALPATLGAAAASGSLPQARSDSAAAVIGSTAYIVGGYDGTNFDPVVLATTDGITFKAVASLPVPVRYPAIAVLAGKIYVFGGQTANGAPTAAVQVVNPSARSAVVAGSLPEAVTGASAVALKGVLYVMGGESSAAGGVAPNATIWAFDQNTG